MCGAVHTLFVCVPAIVEIVVVVVVVVGLRMFGYFFLLIKNQALSIEFPYEI